MGTSARAANLHCVVGSPHQINMKLKVFGPIILFAGVGAAPASEADADPQFFDAAAFPAPVPSAFPMMGSSQGFVPQMMPDNQMMKAPMMPHGSPAPEMPFAHPGTPDMVASHGFESVHDMPLQFMDEPRPMGPPSLPAAGQFGAPEMAMSRPYPRNPQMPFGQPGPSSHPFNQQFYSLPSNCQREEEIIMTGSCKPSLENVCNTETLQTEEIKYEKVCRDVINTICGDHGSIMSQINKREADAVPEADAKAKAEAGADAVADADAQFFRNQRGTDTAVAVPNSATLKSSCQEITTEYCFDSPRVEMVPVEVEHCHRVTKANCVEEETPVPKITCHPADQQNAADNNSSSDYPDYEGVNQS